MSWQWSFGRWGVWTFGRGFVGREVWTGVVGGNAGERATEFLGAETEFIMLLADRCRGHLMSGNRESVLAIIDLANK